MQAWHRCELIRNFTNWSGIERPWSTKDFQGVDEGPMRACHESRGHKREEGKPKERHAGHDRKTVANTGISVGQVLEAPEQRCNRDNEMHGAVVRVEALHKEPRSKKRLLDGLFAKDVEKFFCPNNALGVCQGLSSGFSVGSLAVAYQPIQSVEHPDIHKLAPKAQRTPLAKILGSVRGGRHWATSVGRGDGSCVVNRCVSQETHMRRYPLLLKGLAAEEYDLPPGLKRSPNGRGRK